METTIRNASYTSIPLQSKNEDPKTSSENTEGSFRTSNGKARCVAIGVGVVFIGGAALALLGGLGLLSGAVTKSTPTQSPGNTTSPLPRLANTQGFEDRTGRGITTVISTISTSTQELIISSLTTAPEPSVTHTFSSWQNSSNMAATTTGDSSTSGASSNANSTTTSSTPGVSSSLASHSSSLMSSMVTSSITTPTSTTAKIDPPSSASSQASPFSSSYNDTGSD
ncbi:hypothetical protein J7438_15150 [Thalassotalea sp. G20_0]|uniref:hypothetical protein n=1 Tax=Thalassotalea sp. G20_0 TaxID=2821093 RepID=UPI001ADC78D9|nr:hypothetical protein [Thalassotalea sp. G20_0]MBO9495414.1 hypothetical protein [Thalassotalea sp. G20_0]